jgi:hypothetical protein
MAARRYLRPLRGPSSTRLNEDRFVAAIDGAYARFGHRCDVPSDDRAEGDR